MCSCSTGYLLNAGDLNCTGKESNFTICNRNLERFVLSLRCQLVHNQ